MIFIKRIQTVGKSTGKNKTKMKTYNTREAMKVARKNGWYIVRQKGDHTIWKHPHSDKILTISRGLNRMVWERCVVEYNLNLNV